MTEDIGHFQNGKWVHNEPSTPETEKIVGYEERVSSATNLIKQGIGELFSVTNELIRTKEGKKHIGKKLDKATEEVLKACDEIGSQLHDEATNIGKKLDSATEDVKKITGELGKQMNEKTEHISKKIADTTEEVKKTGNLLGDQISHIVSKAKRKIKQ